MLPGNIRSSSDRGNAAPPPSRRPRRALRYDRAGNLIGSNLSKHLRIAALTPAQFDAYLEQQADERRAQTIADIEALALESEVA